MASSFFDKIKNIRGLTLMELVVSLGLVAILMVVFVSGNIFVHKMLKNWSSGNILSEEREYIHSLLAEYTAGCDAIVQDTINNSIRFYTARDSIVCQLDGGRLILKGKPAHRPEIIVRSVEVSPVELSESVGEGIISEGKLPQTSCLYRINLKLSYRGEEDESYTIIRNIKEFAKH
ncbi:MAG: hypothetical protein V3V99_01930 [candidate division Zixibacteria bacterium]